MAPGYHHHELPARRGRLIGHRCGLRAGGEPRAPQHAAARHVVAANIIVERGTEEGHSARRQHRPTQCRHAELERQRQRRFVADGAVRVLPHHLARDEIEPGDIAQAAPGRAARASTGTGERGPRTARPCSDSGRVRPIHRDPIRPSRPPRASTRRDRPAEAADRRTPCNWDAQRRFGGRGRSPCRPSPSPRNCRKDDRALQRWGRERPVVAQPAEADAAGELNEHGGTPHVRLADAGLRHERHRRIRLRRREAVTGRRAAGHGRSVTGCTGRPVRRSSTKMCRSWSIAPARARSPARAG